MQKHEETMKITQFPSSEGSPGMRQDSPTDSGQPPLEARAKRYRTAQKKTDVIDVRWERFLNLRDGTTRPCFIEACVL